MGILPSKLSGQMENENYPDWRKFLRQSALAGGMILLLYANLQACSSAFNKKNQPSWSCPDGSADDIGEVDAENVLKAFDESDILIHGSEPFIEREKCLRAWVIKTWKSFGIFGTTIQWMNSGLKELLNKASFIYTRETASLKVLDSEVIIGQQISFAPDATFYLNNLRENRAVRKWPTRSTSWMNYYSLPCRMM